MALGTAGAGARRPLPCSVIGPTPSIPTLWPACQAAQQVGTQYASRSTTSCLVQWYQIYSGHLPHPEMYLQRSPDCPLPPEVRVRNLIQTRQTQPTSDLQLAHLLFFIRSFQILVSRAVP